MLWKKKKTSIPAIGEEPLKFISIVLHDGSTMEGYTDISYTDYLGNVKWVRFRPLDGEWIALNINHIVSMKILEG